MDGTRFDDLLRTVSATPSRRGMLAGIASGLLAVLPSTLGGDDAEAKKKRKNNKKKKKRTSPPPPSQPPLSFPPPPPLSPPPDGCPSGQTPCDGGCIPSSQCCDNTDCSVSAQFCTTARQCECPAGLPEICGGACQSLCPTGYWRNPNTCGCCVANFQQVPGTIFDCCSQHWRPIGDRFFCWPLDPGASCSFNAQCLSNFCLCGAFGCGCQ
jgi:hypothetical protein